MATSLFTGSAVQETTYTPQLSLYECLLLCNMSRNGAVLTQIDLQDGYQKFEEAQLKGFSAKLGSARYKPAHTEYVTFNTHKNILADQFRWNILRTSEDYGISDEGYFGVAYYRLRYDGTIELTFSHRGTCFDDRGNVLADITIAHKKKPRIVDVACAFVNAVFSEVGKSTENNFYIVFNFSPTEIYQYPLLSVFHTGFSLGGFIASACAACNFPRGSYAYPVDAPSIKGIAELNTDPAAMSRIQSYVTRPNLVNTCNGQLEENTFQLIPLKDSEFNKAKGVACEIDGRDILSWFAPAHQQSQGCLCLVDTANSHSLLTIIDEYHKFCAVNPSKNFFVRVYAWPEAINEFIIAPADQLLKFKIETYSEAIVSLINMGVAVSQVVPKLWKATAYRNEQGQVVGLIGVKHTRSNVVYYSKEEMQKAEQEAIRNAIGLGIVLAAPIIGELKAHFDRRDQATAAASAVAGEHKAKKASDAFSASDTAAPYYGEGPGQPKKLFQHASPAASAPTVHQGAGQQTPAKDDQHKLGKHGHPPSKRGGHYG